MNSRFNIPNDLTQAAKELIQKIANFDKKYPGALQPEFLDWLAVIEHGAQKYALNNWLEPDGKRCSRKDMHDSITHHRAESLVNGPSAKDKDSGLHPNLHEICRSNMNYVRDVREIKHPDDPKPLVHVFEEDDYRSYLDNITTTISVASSIPYSYCICPICIDLFGNEQDQLPESKL